jgi:hypothetical protein
LVVYQRWRKDGAKSLSIPAKGGFKRLTGRIDVEFKA